MANARTKLPNIPVAGKTTVSAPPADVADVPDAEVEADETRELTLLAKVLAAELRLALTNEILLASDDCMLDILDEMEDCLLGTAVAASELKEEIALLASDVIEE